MLRRIEILNVIQDVVYYFIYSVINVYTLFPKTCGIVSHETLCRPRNIMFSMLLEVRIKNGYSESEKRTIENSIYRCGFINISLRSDFFISGYLSL